MSETVDEYNPNIDVVVMIGNSDDRLSQIEWAQYAEDVFDCVQSFAAGIHGIWWSETASVYQNAAMCATLPGRVLHEMSVELGELAKTYRQDSIAILGGTTEFIKAAT